MVHQKHVWKTMNVCSTPKACIAHQSICGVPSVCVVTKNSPSQYGPRTQRLCCHLWPPRTAFPYDILPWLRMWSPPVDFTERKWKRTWVSDNHKANGQWWSSKNKASRCFTGGISFCFLWRLISACSSNWYVTSIIQRRVYAATETGALDLWLFSVTVWASFLSWCLPSLIDVATFWFVFLLQLI